MKTIKALLIPCLLLLTSAVATAQNPSKAQSQTASAQSQTDQPPQFFRLKFVLKQLEGKKVINSRIYTTEISAEPYTTHAGHYIFFNPFRPSSIRAATKVHYKSGNAYLPVDVGVEIDCRNTALVRGKLGMNVTADISYLAKSHAQPSQDTSIPTAPPITLHDRWSSDVLIPIGRPSILFTSDDPASTNILELDVIATLLH